MNEQLLARLGEVPDLALLPQEPSARHNVWRVGGPMDLLVVVETEAALLELAQQVKEHGGKLHPLDGLGWLCADSGVEGIWVRLGQLAEGNRRTETGLDLGAATPLAVAEAFAAREGLSGLEDLHGAAGTVAEAARAGLFGAHVERLRVLRGARITELDGERLKEDHLLLRVMLRLNPAPAGKIQAARRKALESARTSGAHRPGRVFADHKRTPAAEHLVDLHLPGVRLRGTRFGSYEPNCVLNLGGATEKDIRMLLHLARDRARQQLGVELIAEIKPLSRRGKADEL